MVKLLSLCGAGMVMGLVAAHGTVYGAEEPNNSLVREVKSSDLPSIGVMTPLENDKRIVRWLALDHRMIIECAKMAKDRGTREDVKKLADSLTVNHQKFLDELSGTKAATTVNNTTKGVAKAELDQAKAESSVKETNAKTTETTLGDNTPDRRRTAVVIKDDGSSRADAVVYQPTDFLAVREDICNQLKSIAKKEFENVEGADFDRAFLKHQAFAHEMLLASLRAVRPSATAARQANIDSQIEKLEQHLEQIQKLLPAKSDSVTTTSSK